MSGPASALAQDSPAEVPDIAVSEAQPVTTGPSYGIATASSTSRLWATVNICDTAGAPNSMGVRAGMPGNASRQRMFMRFSAEYWSRLRQDWAPVAGSGVSPWVYAGPARYERRQAGWTFVFVPPPAGVTFTMRAQVKFQWRRPDERAAEGGRAKRRRGAKRKHSAKRKHRAKRTFRVERRRAVKRARRFKLRGSRRSRATHSRVVRTVIRTTETGIRGVDGGDPAGTSKAMCLIY
ncbi:MAG: hypothetical protein ACRDLY_02925 [Thermoleophilaceae bacterium]